MASSRLPRLLFVDAREAQHHVDLAARVLEARQLGREQVREPGPMTRLGCEALQVGQHVGIRRVDVQGPSIGLEGLALVRQAPLLELGDARQQLDPARGVVGVRLHDLVHGDDAIPLARALVDGLEHARGEHGLFAPPHQGLERAQRGLVRRVHLEDAAVSLDGARQVLEVLAPQLAHAELWKAVRPRRAWALSSVCRSSTAKRSYQRWVCWYRRSKTWAAS